MTAYTFGKHQLTNVVSNILLYGIVLGFLSYAFPMLYSFFESTNFTYVNAWDEETYLTYQGALGMMATPGYMFPGLVVYLLHNFGLSGAEINLLFDLVIFPFSFFLLSKILQLVGIDKRRSCFYSFVIFFSPVLFNLANPYIAKLFSREYGIFAYGFEGYQSILRTPEPQLSYLLVLIAIHWFLKKKKVILLIWPVPFLYFFVDIPYVYFLLLVASYVIFIKLKFNQFLALVFSCFSAYFLTSFGYVILDFFYFSPNQANFGGHYINRHLPMIPISGCVLCCFLAIQSILIKRKEQEVLDNKQFRLLLVVVLSVFLLANIHVISGSMLAYKNYHDYGLGFLSGLGIVLFLHYLHQEFFRSSLIFSIVVSTLILAIMLPVYGFDFSKLEIRFFRGLQFKSRSEYRKVVNNPFNVIIPISDLSAKLPYSASKAIIPIFSYQYSFPFISRSCPSILNRMEDAIEFMKKDRIEVFENNKTYFESKLPLFIKSEVPAFSYILDNAVLNACRYKYEGKKFIFLKEGFKDDGWIRIPLLGQ